MPNKVTVEFDTDWIKNSFCKKCPCQQCEQMDEDVIKCCVIVDEEYFKIKEKHYEW